MFRASLVFGVGLGLALTSVSVQAREPFQPSADLQIADLQDIVREGASVVESARLQVDLAGAEVRQSRLIPNPVLDLSWGTIPIGPSNPPDLERPLANIPNYGVGIGFPILIGKRRPRIQRARSLEAGAGAELDAVVRSEAFDLATVLGELATASLRVEDLQDMVALGERSIAAAQTRVDLSYGPPLDVDRLRIELARTQQSLLAARSDIRLARADCALHVGRPCEGFASSAEARAYLEAWIESKPATLALADRPDLRALARYGEAAQASRKLARALRFPTPTIRFGYLQDRFVVAGNQRNSLAVSLVVPLPIFDRGQAQRLAAEAQVRRLAAERDKRIAVVEARVPALLERATLERDRQILLRDEAIPTAKQITRTLESAVNDRLASVTEVVTAQRTLRELLLEEADAYAAAYQARLEVLRMIPTDQELQR